MFTLLFTNLPDVGAREFATEAEAIAAGRKAGFEFTVWNGGALVASWSTFGGMRREVIERHLRAHPLGA